MNMDKITQGSRDAMVSAQNLAIDMGHQQLDVEHLAYVLLEQDDGLVPKLLKSAGVDVSAVKADLLAELEKIAKVSGAADNLYSSRRFNRILINAEKEAGLFSPLSAGLRYNFPVASDLAFSGPCRRNLIGALMSMSGDVRVRRTKR